MCQLFSLSGMRSTYAYFINVPAHVHDHNNALNSSAEWIPLNLASRTDDQPFFDCNIPFQFHNKTIKFSTFEFTNSSTELLKSDSPLSFSIEVEDVEWKLYPMIPPSLLVGTSYF